MAEVIIPDLPEETTFNENAMIPFDSGIQSFKITTENFAIALRPLIVPAVESVKTGNFAMSAVTDLGKVFKIDSTSGAFTITLPNPATVPGGLYWVKDVAGKLSTNPVQLENFAAENIEGLASNLVLSTDFETWGFYTDGTNWWVI